MCPTPSWEEEEEEEEEEEKRGREARARAGLRVWSRRMSAGCSSSRHESGARARGARARERKWRPTINPDELCSPAREREGLLRGGRGIAAHLAVIAQAPREDPLLHIEGQVVEGAGHGPHDVGEAFHPLAWTSRERAWEMSEGFGLAEAAKRTRGPRRARAPRKTKFAHVGTAPPGLEEAGDGLAPLPDLPRHGAHDRMHGWGKRAGREGNGKRGKKRPRAGSVGKGEASREAKAPGR